PARRRTARTEVEVREPGLPAAVAPLGAQHDEVVRADRLHLAPRLAAAAGGVERRSVFDDDALVARGERLLEHPPAVLGIGRERARYLQVRRDLLQPRGALLEGHVEQVLAVDVEHVE